MALSKEDINLYVSSIGRVFCYPSFTSTSSLRGKFTPIGNYSDDEVVLLEIKQNGSKNAISVEEFSAYKGEKEYIFPPFSFFKIAGIKREKGTPQNPHIIQLLAIKTEKPLEETFEDFFIKETDNLDPEGLDMLILSDNNEKIEFNKKYCTSQNILKKLKSKKSRKI